MVATAAAAEPALLRRLREFPFGAAVKGEGQLERALGSRAAVVFILRGDGLEMAPSLARIHKARKLAAVHLDLVGGVGLDHSGVRWLALAGADAVITSHGHLVRTIQAEGVVAIQRLLLTEMTSVVAGMAAVERARPDIVELLPGVILPHVRDLILPRLTVPLLAGGFIRDRAAVKAVLAAGAAAVSTSSTDLWG
ncbi:MAG: glycerol-3-phosphate responsive antiterminator [Candidatus Dormibacterales bacterium]